MKIVKGVIVSACIVSIGTVIGLLFFIFFKLNESSDWDKIDKYSSVFGNFSGPILSLASIVLVITTIWIQIKELNETRLEMSKSTKALQEQQEEKQKEVLLALNNAKKEDYHRAISYLSNEIKSLMTKRVPHPNHSYDDSLENLLNLASNDLELMSIMKIDYKEEISKAHRWYVDLLEKCDKYDGISEAKITPTIKDNFMILERLDNDQL
ncbi:hypothetical protein H4F20_02460 [Vibrio sp. 16]